MTLSAGTIIHSVPLTEFSVTGRYQLPRGVLMNKISTHQSTWMEKMESVTTTASMKEKGDAFFLLRQWTCDGSAGIVDGIGVGIVKDKGLLLQHWHQRWRD
jgi:hypothetical protein